MEKFYLAALGSAVGLGHKSIAKLVKFFGSAKALWTADLDYIAYAGMKRKTIEAFVSFRHDHPDEPEKLAEYCERHKIGLCSIFDNDYPPMLKEIDSPPMFFYYRGKLQPCLFRIGIVGSRNCSPYGEYVALDISEDIAAAGMTVVSGAARGIDSFAHKGALKTGRTVAVLGCGINCKLPREKELFLAQIAENGVVMSELNPQIVPTPGNLVARNRIIAGLCKGIVVVEAALKSGTMITANYAAKYGRDIFAVPNNSAGGDKLIRNGAIPINSARTVLDTYYLAEIIK